MTIEPQAERVSPSYSAIELETGQEDGLRVEVLSRLKKNDVMLRAASFAASQFLTLPWQQTLQATLRALGEAMGVSRVSVVEQASDLSQTPRQHAHWASAGWDNAPDKRWNEKFWRLTTASGQTVQLNKNAESSGDSLSACDNFLGKSSTWTLIAAPVQVANQVWGYVILEECPAPRAWDDAEAEVLQLFADILGSAIARFRIDEAFRSSESQLRALTGAMSDVIFVLDRSGRYLNIIGNNSSLLARPCDEVIEKTVDEVLSPDLAREFLGVVRDVLNTKSLRSLEYPLEIEGKTTWFSASVTPLSDETVLWVARDVTPARRARESLRESEALFRLLAENSTDKIACLSLDGTFRYLSPSVKTLLGYEPGELVGTNAATMIHPEDRSIVKGSLFHIQSTPGASDTIAYRMRKRSGDYVWFETTSRIVSNQNNRSSEIHSVSRDISERREAEEALRAAEAKYRSIFENAVEGIFQTTPDGHYLHANPSLARIYGYESPRDLQLGLVDISKQLYVNPHRRLDFVAEMEKNGAVANFEAQIWRKDGQIIWISENARAVRDAAGTLLYYEGTVEDITARKNAEEQLLHDALHDKLTGLSNRALYMDRLGQALARLKRHPEAMFAALFLDFDRFKNVNDSLGHMAGDQLLIAVSGRISECLRPGDTISRLGGDEFAVLLEDVADVEGAILVAERIQDAMSAPFRIQSQEVFTSASIGIAMGNVSYRHPEEILRDADMAMYRAKALGKARHHVFDAGMHKRAVALLQLETDLRHAIEREEFLVLYQPIISLVSGEISGFEALVRWQHPTRGLVSPLDFIPIAEETGWIVPIGRWVLNEACCQLAQWRKQSPTQKTLSMSVNLSSKQFAQPDLLLEIAEVLERHSLPASCLKLEITESALMERAPEITARLFELRQMGVQLGLDDFGTGYSSLSYLHRFPLDTLKIDRSFIANMSQDGENSEIVRTVVALGKNLGMNVVAEGVEDAEQLSQLRQLGCNNGQGYHFARPLNPEDAWAMLQDAPVW